MELCAHHAIQVVLNAMKPKMTPSVASANQAIFLRVQPALTLARQDHGLMMMLETLHNTHNARYVRLIVKPVPWTRFVRLVRQDMAWKELCARDVIQSVLSVLLVMMLRNAQSVTGGIILKVLQHALLRALQGHGPMMMPEMVVYTQHAKRAQLVVQPVLLLQFATHVKQVMVRSQICAQHVIPSVLSAVKVPTRINAQGVSQGIFLIPLRSVVMYACKGSGQIQMMEVEMRTPYANLVRLVVQPALQILSAGHVKVGMVLWEICAKSVSPSVLSVIQGRMRQNVQGVTGGIILIALQRVLITVLQGIGQIQ